MQYDKRPLSFSEQADLLISRGMTGDRRLMVQRLRSVSYFRLSGYSYPFRKKDPANPGCPHSDFEPGTEFATIWERYVFDRRLRLVVMDAVERIEVAIRSEIATHHSTTHGHSAYARDPKSMPGMNWQTWVDFVGTVKREQVRSKDVFVRHFRSKYAEADPLPLWMAAEVWSFGTLLSFYEGCGSGVRKAVAEKFGVHDNVFASWLLTLNTVRNICAHHGRLWNREIGTKPKIPERLAEWRTPVRVTGDRVFAVLTICKWCLDRIASQSRWPLRLRELLEAYPGVPRESMGFPSHWERCPIWTTSART